MNETTRSLPGFHAAGLSILLLAGLATSCDDSGNIGVVTPTNSSPNAVFTPAPTQVPANDNHTTVVTLDGSASTDADGDPIAFAWAVGPSGRFVNGTNSAMPVPQVTFPGTGSYNVVLTVRDDRGGIDSASFTITTAASNDPPTAVVTADPSIVPTGDNFTTIVDLDGTGSSDPDGDPLTYSWTVPGGPVRDWDHLIGCAAPVSFPGVADDPVTLLVSDGRGGTDSAFVTMALGPWRLEAPGASRSHRLSRRGKLA